MAAPTEAANPTGSATRDQSVIHSHQRGAGEPSLSQPGTRRHHDLAAQRIDFGQASIRLDRPQMTDGYAATFDIAVQAS
jgi:hypothetical protein